MAESIPAGTQQDLCISVTDLARFVEETPTELRQDLKKISNNITNHVPPLVARQYLESKGRVFPKKIVSIQMLKGGVAKTTSLLNVGLRAAMYGARVLFVDLDQQANLSFALGVESDEGPVWIDLLEKKATLRDLIRPVDPPIDLIPSNLNNSVIDRHLMSSNRNWAYSVKNPLESLRSEYDLILIDTAPALSAINTAVTVASDEIILPVTPDRFSWLGLMKHLHELEQQKEDFRLDFEEKILFTRYDGREKASQEFLQICIDQYADKLMSAYIRTSADVKNGLRGPKNVFSLGSPVKEDFDLITREVLNFDV